MTVPLPSREVVHQWILKERYNIANYSPYSGTEYLKATYASKYFFSRELFKIQKEKFVT